MSTLHIESPLADRIRAVAEREQRSIEAVLDAMLEKYAQPTDEEIDARLRLLSGIVPPSDELLQSPLTDEEDQALADLIGVSGQPLSQLIIEQRKQGY